MDAFLVAIQSVWTDSGYVALNMGNITMIVVGLILLYLAIGKGYEPLLLTPIAFGCVLANFPNNGFHEGVMWAIGQGIQMEIFPPLIFLGVGAMTDFGPLIANPNTLMLGAAAQFGVFVALGGAMLLGFNVQEAASIGIIGGADGPTAIYLATKLAPDLLGAIAVAAYSYMSLVPLIQPPIMRLFTTKEERAIKMGQLREVTRFERIVFPIMATIIISLLLPPIASLIGMLMLGNLFRESGVTDRLSDTSQNALCNIVTIFLALGTGLTMSADKFLRLQTVEIIFLGLVAFAGGTAEIENASGVGTVGNAKCGDIMRIYLDIDENQIIRDVKFKTFGCGAAVATSSMATEMVKGKSIQEAMEVTNKAVMEALDGLPPVKVHCSLLAEEAIHAALWDYAEKHGIKIEGLQKPKSDIHEGEEAEEEEY